MQMHQKISPSKKYNNYLIGITIVLCVISLIHLISLFYGFDLSDEGYAMLLSDKSQEVGTLGVHFYHLTRLLPVLTSYPVFESRVLRTLLITISTLLLFFTTKKIKKSQDTRILFLFAVSVALISLSDGIKVLSYNSINLVIIILYSSLISLYLFSKNEKLRVLGLIISSMLISITYLIRLPSFFLYIIIHLLFILVKYERRWPFLVYSLIAFFTFAASLLFINEMVYPIEQVFQDLKSSSSFSLNDNGKHGPIQSVLNIVALFQRLVVLFMTSYFFISLLNLTKKHITDKFVPVLAKIFSLLTVIVILFIRPLSFASPIFFSLFVTFLSHIKGQNYTQLFNKTFKEIIISCLFILLGVAASFGSLAPGITIISTYVPVLIVPFYLFMPKRKKHRIFLVSFFVTLAMFRVIINDFVIPYRQAPLFAKHKKFVMSDGKYVFLDEDMYNYVTTVNNFIVLKGYEDREIIAIDRLPGLVFLLNTNMPDSILFGYMYWDRYCNDLNTMKEKPVIIIRESVDERFFNCLQKKADIDFSNDYKLGAVIDQTLTGFGNHTQVFVPIENR